MTGVTTGMAEILVQLMVSVGLSSLFATGIVFLTKTWISERIKGQIKAEYDTKLESHKAQLKAAGDVEVERLRSQLSILASERQISFSGLYEKRAVVIAEVYSLLKELALKTYEYVAVFQPKGQEGKHQRYSEAGESYNEFHKYFKKTSVYLPKGTLKIIRKIDFELKGVIIDFQVTVDSSLSPDYRRWADLSKKVKARLDEGFPELEQEFQLLLGGDPIAREASSAPLAEEAGPV